MGGWKTAIERKSKTNAKWKKKVAVFVRVKGMWQVFGFEQEKRSSMGYYFGNCEKKTVAMATEILLPNELFLNQLQKMKCLKKLMKERKKMGKKRF